MGYTNAEKKKKSILTPIYLPSIMLKISLKFDGEYKLCNYMCFFFFFFFLVNEVRWRDREHRVKIMRKNVTFSAKLTLHSNIVCSQMMFTVFF